MLGFNPVIACNYEVAMTETWWSYVQRISAGAPNRDIAIAAELTPSAISRWKTGDVPRAENVIAFARGYNRPPQEALVVAGYLDESEAAEVVEVTHGLSDFDVVALVAELQRRVTNNDPRQIEPGSAGDVFPHWSDGDDGEGRTRFR